MFEFVLFLVMLFVFVPLMLLLHPVAFLVTAALSFLCFMGWVQHCKDTSN